MTRESEPEPTRTLRTIDGRRPRVLLVVSVDWFFVSHRLSLAMALRAAGCEVTVAAQETDARPTIEAAGFRFVALPLERGGRDVRAELRLLAFLVALYRRERPDVVHHVSVKPILYGSVAARIAGVPAIINAVSGLGYAFIDRADATKRDAVLRKAVRATYSMALRGRRTHAILQNRDDLEMLTGKREPASARVHLIPGAGVDVNAFVPSPLPDGPPIVLLPARLLWDKGVGEFVEAARRLKAAGSTARFVLVGRTDPANPAGVPDATLQGWLAEGAVEWWGSRPHAAMAATYASAHLVVLPSYREGMPLVLAEAAACGRAVVATDVPGCREIVRPPLNGWLVCAADANSLADAIHGALSDAAELRRRGAAARGLVEAEFSSEAVLRRTIAIYRDALSLA